MQQPQFQEVKRPQGWAATSTMSISPAFFRMGLNHSSRPLLSQQ
jgi:hypothetical protein